MLKSKAAQRVQQSGARRRLTFAIPPAGFSLDLLARAQVIVWVVTKFVGIVALVAVVLLTGADKFSCPDGCTESSEQTASTESHDTVHACILCSLGVETATVPASLTSLGTVATVGTALPSLVRSGIPFALEHPPRRL